MRIVGRIRVGDYECEIAEDDDGRVHFVAGATIDADGANGQHGAPAAYRADDTGSDWLANGGMAIVGGRVVCAKPWARDIAVLGDDGEPKVFDGGLIASKTWYRHPGKAADDPAAYVDSETVPYIVVPPLIVRKTAGIVCGCRGRVMYGGKSVDCVVADLGPGQRIGELSIAAARAIGLRSSPKNGGTGKPQIQYEIWPGTPAPGYRLIPS
jgi:hypothetical protein